MNCLIKGATIQDKHSAWHLKKVDLLIKNGVIEKIAKSIVKDSVKLISADHLYVSPGWFDIGTTLTDPGYEDLDDINSLSESASFGGFTGLAVFPNTNPVMDNKGSLDALKMRSAGNLVQLFPIAALTGGTEGNDISEMMDLKQSGAIAFSEGRKSIQRGGVLNRALKYITTLDSIIINHPNDNSLSESGIMNESGESANLGLKGMPSIAEELMVNRDIRLCEYTESRLLVHMISVKESANLIKRAKKDKLRVFASVSYHNLIETDAALRNFDPMHKVLPPLRSRLDVNALIRALKDDTIDCIVSNHTPVDIEGKKKAFYYADFGALGLEHLFAVLNTRLEGKLDLEIIVDKLSNGPRKVLGLPLATIMEGAWANLTLFDPELGWVFNKKDIKSKSRNAPYIGHEFKGKVLGVIANNKISIFS